MPHKLKLSPLQRDIIVMLEEAGAESAGTVIATLKPSNQYDFDADVDGLERLGLVRREKNNLVLTDKGKIAFRT